MTTATAPAPAATTTPATPATRTASPYRLTLGHEVRSEWIKLVTLRSTWWSAAIVFALSVGISVLVALQLTSNDLVSPESANGSIASAVTLPSMFTVLLACILGTIFVTGEYSTGMIRSTLTAAPDRTRAFLAKALSVFGFVVALSLITNLVALAVTLPIFGGVDAGLDLSDPATAVLPYIWNALYLAGLALLGLGVGFAVRSGAGSLAIVAGIVFVLPIVASMLGMVPNLDWIQTVANYLPMNAGSDFVQNTGDAQLRGGLAIAGWAVAGLAAGYVVLKTRDA
ncbi:ABC transporter permease subunit [Microbacterium gorillae]|uniref:ABC transporter permease subunit n=1 Tax=Microbacterium gorillae TaxID=1231063 RepID=UPI00058CC194|nr:ABC transporter permease subunit [Microbacterium gorillae]